MASSSFSMKAYEYTHTRTHTRAHTRTPIHPHIHTHTHTHRHTHTHTHTYTHTHRISAGIVCPRYTGFKTIRSTNAIVYTSFYNVKQCPKTPENIARSLIFKNDRGKHIFRQKQKYHVPGVKRGKLSLKHFRL